MGKPKSKPERKVRVVREKQPKPPKMGVGMTYLRSTYRREAKESGMSLKAWVGANAEALLERCVERIEDELTMSRKAERLLT